MNRIAPVICCALVGLAFTTRADAGITSQLAVCAVRLDPTATNGSSGAVLVSLKANYAACDDNNVPYTTTTYFCSKQPTNNSCTTATTFHYSESGLQGLYQAVIQAQVNERFVEVFHEGSNTTRGQQLRSY
jgi:hypothetical protein